MWTGVNEYTKEYPHPLAEAVGMTDEIKQLYFAEALKLYTLNKLAECELFRLRELVARGVPYDSRKMRRALKNFAKADIKRNWLKAELERKIEAHARHS